MISGIRTRALVAVLGIVAVTGCSEASAPSRSSEPDSAVARDTETPQRTWCDMSIARQRTLPRGYDAVLGAVGLPTARTARRAQQAGDGAGAGVLFAKTALLLRGDEPIVIEQVPGSGDAGEPPLLLGWGETEPAARFTARPCPRTPGWRVFTGGLYLTRPSCVRLRVHVGARSTEVSVGAGAPCPGQRRPAGPAVRAATAGRGR